MRWLSQEQWNAKIEAADSVTAVRWSTSRTRAGFHIKVVKGIAIEWWFVGVALDQKCKSIIEWLG